MLFQFGNSIEQQIPKSSIEHIPCHHILPTHASLEKEFFPFFSFSSFYKRVPVGRQTIVVYVAKPLFYFFSQLSFIQFTTLHLSTEDDIHLVVEIFEGLRHIGHRETPEGRTAAGVKFTGCTLHLQRPRIDRRTAFLGSDYTTPQ